MIKEHLYKALLLLAALTVFCSCEDTPYYGQGIPSEFNKTYSSKSNKDHVTGDLNLVYSGEQMLGKDVYFNLMSASTADLKFYSVFPGESVVTAANVELTEIVGGYKFSGGTYTSPLNTTYSLLGYVINVEGSNVPLLSVEITQVTIASNTLSQRSVFTLPEYRSEFTALPEYPGYICYDWTVSVLLDWKYKETFIDEEGEEYAEDRNILEDPSMDMTTILTPMLSNLMYLLLDNLYFYPDGTLSATYCSLGELDYMQLIFGTTTDSDRGTKSVSPRGFLTYNVIGDKVYIRPELMNIISYIQANNASTRADGDDEEEVSGGFNIMELLSVIMTVINDVYPELQRWLDQGICFNFVANDPEAVILDYMPMYTGQFVYMFDGAYKLYLNYEELGPIVSLLPFILDNIDISLGDGIPISLDGLFEAIGERAPLTTRLNLGLYLN